MMLRPFDQRRLRRLIEEHQDAQQARANQLNDLIDKLDQRLDNITAQLNRADVVQTLPASAPRGYLLVTPGDTSVYVGQGAAQPLRRILTQPLI